MKSLEISLNSSEVKGFVNIVGRYPFEVDLKSGRFLIDAKSLLGILSLDLSKPVVLEIHSNDCDELIADLEEFVV